MKAYDASTSGQLSCAQNVFICKKKREIYDCLYKPWLFKCYKLIELKKSKCYNGHTKSYFETIYVIIDAQNCKIYAPNVIFGALNVIIDVIFDTLTVTIDVLNVKLDALNVTTDSLNITSQDLHFTKKRLTCMSTVLMSTAELECLTRSSTGLRSSSSTACTQSINESFLQYFIIW